MRWRCPLTRLRQLGQHLFPINDDIANRGERRLAFELENGRTPVTTSLEPVNGQRAIEGMDEPDFAHARSLIGREFHRLVVAGRTRREDFRDPVRGTAHTSRIDFLRIRNDENIGLHHGVNLVVRIAGLG